jgi:3-oxoadipate enol-lactonase
MATYGTRDLGDRTLAFLDHGTGHPVLFIHAFPLSAAMWQQQIERLPDGWRALAPDLRGFHHSRRGGAPPARHVRDHAADVLAVLQAEATGPAVVVGLSMGGYIALECWRQRPDLIRGLVLADTRAEADTEEARAKRREMQHLVQTQGTAAVADAMLPKLLGPTTQTAEPHLATEVRRLIEGNTPDAVADALDALATRPDSRPLLASITCPALVIVGEEDELTPPAMAQTLAEGIPSAVLVQIGGAGHLSNLEQPDRFSEVLNGWLASLPPR